MGAHIGFGETLDFGEEVAVVVEVVVPFGFEVVEVVDIVELVEVVIRLGSK